MRGIDLDWLPTPGSINALPDPLRRYIHDLETSAGNGAHLIQENFRLRQQNEQLQSAIELGKPS